MSRALAINRVQAATGLSTRLKGGFQANDVGRLKQLEAENARLKKLVAKRDLEIEVMKDARGRGSA